MAELSVESKAWMLTMDGRGDDAKLLRQCGRADLSNAVMALVVELIGPAGKDAKRIWPWRRPRTVSGDDREELDRRAMARAADEVRRRGPPRKVELRFDGTDEVVEATLLNGWISDQFLQGMTLKTGDASGATFQLQLSSGRRWRPFRGVGSSRVAARIGRHIEYAPEQQLLVLDADRLVDATVQSRVGSIGSRHKLLVDGSQIELDLNPWNHGLRRIESLDAFHEACARYLDEQFGALSEVQDGITGNLLKIEDQLIYIETVAFGAAVNRYSLPPLQKGDQVERGLDWRKGGQDPGIGTVIKEANRRGSLKIKWAATGKEGYYRYTSEKVTVVPVKRGVQRSGWSNARDMTSLAELLGAPSPARSQGTHDAQSVLLVAGPGTGKTWSTQQLAYLLVKKAQASSEPLPLLPLLVRVQRMLAVLKGAGVDVASWNHADGRPSLLEEYIRVAFAEDGAVRDALLQAYALNSLVVILDGADEAAALRTPLETLVLQRLDRMRVVLSSRPQDLNGVDARRFKHFVILDLKPLSEEQQSKAVSNQLANAEQFTRLTAFGKIRKEHDRIYKSAFPDEKERREIEAFEQPNLFFKDGTRDPGMRQQRRDGSGFVRVCTASAPASAYLSRLCDIFTAPLLAELHAALEGVTDEAGVKAAVAGLSHKDAQRLRAAYGDRFFDLEDDASAEQARREALKQDAAFKDLKLAVKLGLLLQKRREKEAALKLAALWGRVWRRTDDVFVATEDLKQVFEEAVREFAAQLGLTEEALKFGPLKDAVRIHEKAMDDYIRDFHDWDDAVIIPEACVVDVLRVRIVVRSGKQMLQLQRMLREGFEVKVAGKITLLRLIRAKNKLATIVDEERGLAGLDPTHFRNILNNVQLIHDGRTVFAELQVHHAAILDFNDASHAHDHYNFFRARFAEDYGRKLDSMLESAIVLFEEVSGNPVLLSMLVLIFADDSELLPSSKRELYRMATRAAIAKRLASVGARDSRTSRLERRASFVDGGAAASVQRVLSRVAIAAHLAEKREFTGQLVEEAIGGAELEQWNRLLDDARGLPLVKTIQAGDGDAASFQFAHLSFQEGLFAQALADGSAAEAVAAHFGDEHLKLLGSPWFLNALTIGGKAVGARLKVGDAKLKLSKEEAKGLRATRWEPVGTTLTQLDLVGSGLGAGDIKTLAEELKSNATLTTLTQLKLGGSVLNAEGVKPLAEALKTNATLTELDLVNSYLGLTGGIKPLAEALETNATLKQLNLRDNGLGAEGIKPLAEALKTNATLTQLNLRDNGLGDKGVKPLAEALETNVALTQLDLSRNGLRAKGGRALAKALKKNATLTQLELGGNNLGTKTEKLLREAVKSNGKLK